MGTRNSSWIAIGKKLAQIIEQIRDRTLGHLGEAARDARAPDQKCLLDVSGREAKAALLRSLWLLQLELERSKSGELVSIKSHVSRGVFANVAART